MKSDFVLNLLKENKAHFLSGEDISKKLKVSRAMVWKEIHHLRELGYDIHAQPHLGYKLVSIPDKLFADELSYALGTKIVGKSIVSYDEIDSTNDAVTQLGEKGAAEGTAVFAEFQKKGRGRLGRSWVSPKGRNILFSVLLRPSIPPQDTAKITLLAAISIVRTIEQMTGVKAGIKWPNDIYHEGKKLAGILTEMSAEPDRVKFVTVGIGIDINSKAPELPDHSTSVSEMAGHAVSRLEFARALLKQLDRDYGRFKAGKFEELARDWEELSVTSGRRVEATVLNRKIQGTAMGIDAEGALVIRSDTGMQERVLAGDIRHLG